MINLVYRQSYSRKWIEIFITFLLKQQIMLFKTFGTRMVKTKKIG